LIFIADGCHCRFLFFELSFSLPLAFIFAIDTAILRHYFRAMPFSLRFAITPLP
jgi:hypothetical protein